MTWPQCSQNWGHIYNRGIQILCLCSYAHYYKQNWKPVKHLCILIPGQKIVNEKIPGEL